VALTDAGIDRLAGPLTELYADLETELITDIAGWLARLDYASGSVQWELEKLRAIEALNASTISRIAAVARKTPAEIERSIAEATSAVLRGSEREIAAAIAEGRLPMTPELLAQSAAVRETLIAMLRNAQDRYNLINTAAVQSVNAEFLRLANIAYLRVANGLSGVGDAVRRAVLELADSGISLVRFPSGRVDRLEVAVRRTTVTSMVQAAGKAAIAFCLAVGTDLVEVSSHLGARTGEGVGDHGAWQGKIYCLHGERAGYRNLEQVTGHPSDPLGLQGYNCRHTMRPFVEGVSTPTAHEYDLEENRIAYEESQEQRALERRIRAAKRQEEGLLAANLDAAVATAKRRDAQQQMRDFIEETGRTRRRDREQVWG